MSQQKLLIHVIQALNRHHIEYMVTGSVASSLQGEPRSTHDLDIVVAVKREQSTALACAFPPPHYYLSTTAIEEAIANSSMFNLIDTVDGDKVDFWLLTQEPFDRSRFARKYAEDVFGTKIQVSAPEDTILAKLLWALKSGGSEKHYADALRVFEVQYGNLDLSYIKMWAVRLGVESMWLQLQNDAEIIE